jgi:hypothetical protein
VIALIAPPLFSALVVYETVHSGWRAIAVGARLSNKG